MAKKKPPVNALDELMSGGRKPATTTTRKTQPPTSTIPSSPITAPLVPVESEKQHLQNLEKIINDNIRAFYAVGCALREIRDKQLYKLQGYSNFDDYCQERWDIQRAHAKRLAFASDVVDNLKSDPSGIPFLPTNERQVRPLINLEPEQQRQVWGQVVQAAEKKASSGEPVITAKMVEENVSVVQGKPTQVQAHKTRRLSLLLSKQTDDSLDKSLRKLSKLVDRTVSKKLSKQAVVEAALQVALDHLQQQGKESDLVKQLLAQSEHN